VVHDRDKFHAKRYIWPVGYKATRIYPAMTDPSVKCVYTSEILDGETAPIFSVTAGEGGPVITAATPSAAWTKVVEVVNSLKLERTGKRLFTTVSGPEMFGFSHPTIAKLIQELPGAELCRNYVFQHFLPKVGRPPPRTTGSSTKAKNKAQKGGQTIDTDTPALGEGGAPSHQNLPSDEDQENDEDDNDNQDENGHFVEELEQGNVLTEDPQHLPEQSHQSLPT